MSDRTRSLSSDDVVAFASDGFVLMPDLLDPEVVDYVYEACARLPKRRLRKSGVWYVREPDVLRDSRLIAASTEAALVAAVRTLLRGDMHVIALDIAETSPHGGELRTWHRDLPDVTSEVFAVNVCIYLQDMTPETGPLYVLPGSHTRPKAPTAEEVQRPLDGEQALPVGAGTAVLLDSRVWHSPSPNRTDRARRLLSPFFANRSVRRLYKAPLPEQITRSRDEVLRELFPSTVAA